MRRCSGSTAGLPTGLRRRIAPRLQTTSSSPVVYARDANGNVLGGVRTPMVDAPVAALGGVGNSGSGPIGVVLRPVRHHRAVHARRSSPRLYPTHGQFVLKWDLATLRDMFHGYLLLPDALELARAAASSNVGS